MATDLLTWAANNGVGVVWAVVNTGLLVYVLKTIPPALDRQTAASKEHTTAVDKLLEFLKGKTQ